MNERCSALLNQRIISEALQPVDVRLTAELGHLTLRIVTMSLLRCLKSLLPSEVTTQVLHGLLVA